MSNHARGLWGYSGLTAGGRGLSVQATGMGGPSAALVLGTWPSWGCGGRCGSGPARRSPRTCGPATLSGVRRGAAWSVDGRGAGAAARPTRRWRRGCATELGDEARARRGRQPRRPPPRPGTGPPPATPPTCRPPPCFAARPRARRRPRGGPDRHRRRGSRASTTRPWNDRGRSWPAPPRAPSLTLKSRVRTSFRGFFLRFCSDLRRKSADLPVRSSSCSSTSSRRWRRSEAGARAARRRPPRAG